MAARSEGRSPGRLVAASALALVLVSSCTLTRTTVDECKTNTDCRGAFGVGRVCSASSGLCELAPPAPRCAKTFPADVLTRPESYPNVLLVGSLMDRTVETQRAREDAIALAATQVNEAQGLDGRQFGVVFCDISEDPKYDSLKRTEAAIANTRYLAEVVGASTIVGPSSSTDAVAVWNGLVKDLDVVLISPAATSPQLTGLDTKAPSDESPGRLWRTAPPDTLQGNAIVRHLLAAFPAVTKVALVQEKGAYGDSLTQVFKAGFEQGGRTVRSFPYGNSGERDEAIVFAGAEKTEIVLFFSSQTADSIAFLNAAQSLDSYKTTRLFLTDSAANRDVLTGTTGAAAVYPRVIGSRPAVPQGPTFDLFKTSYNAKYRVDPSTFSFVSHSYDATWLAFYGIARSLRQEQKVTGAGVARGLRKLSDGSQEIAVTPGNWIRIADALGAGKTVNILGASGSLDFSLTDEETAGLVDIWKISDNGTAIETVTSIDPR